ncbi:MAG: nicotinate (nicotinamide) nucleotide adenylyltransferase [Eubacterium sp.]|nr:nicotinate (nicotinamide) nucleotide adenylyltransferase [Eubacterium sp.]
MIKVGIFGGAFNPIHNGHISIATQAFKDLKLKKMLIVPTATSPHKDPAGLLDYDVRAELCRLAFADRIAAGQFEICDVEKQLGGTSYTINTVRELKRQYPSDTQFYLIIGGDMLFYFEKWYRYEALLGECKVTAAAREDSEYSDMCEFAARVGRIKVLNLNVVQASSTEVREKLKAGESVSGLVPDAVEKYLLENKLYV